MPVQITGKFRRFSVALVGLAALTLPAAASAEACPDLPTTQAYAKFGDTADYSLVPGGNFERGGEGWKFSNARIASSGINAGVLPGVRGVALGGGFFSGPSGVITPEFCVNSDHPYFRYMLKAKGAVGVLATFIRYKAADGSTIQQQVTSNVSTNLYSGKWVPSELNPLSIKLALGDEETATVQLVFVTPMSYLGAGYYIDDIMVDPYRRG